MNSSGTRRAIAFVALGLVAGLALGSVGLASAATSAPATGSTGAVSGYGLRMGPALRDAGGRLADVVAKLTGLSLTDVYAKRQAGTSYAKIAESKGVSSASVVDEALKVRTTILDEKVADGSITTATRDAALARMKTNLQERVASTDPSDCGAGQGRGRGQGRGAGRGMGGGFGGAGNPDCVYAASAAQ